MTDKLPAETPSAEIVAADETDPVELVEVPAEEALTPPSEWGETLTEEEAAERLEGVEVTNEEPEGTETVA